MKVKSLIVVSVLGLAGCDQANTNNTEMMQNPGDTVSQEVAQTVPSLGEIEGLDIVAKYPSGAVILASNSLRNNVNADSHGDLVMGSNGPARIEHFVPKADQDTFARYKEAGRKLRLVAERPERESGKTPFAILGQTDQGGLVVTVSDFGDVPLGYSAASYRTGGDIAYHLPAETVGIFLASVGESLEDVGTIMDVPGQSQIQANAGDKLGAFTVLERRDSGAIILRSDDLQAPGKVTESAVVCADGGCYLEHYLAVADQRSFLESLEDGRSNPGRFTPDSGPFQVYQHTPDGGAIVLSFALDQVPEGGTNPALLMGGYSNLQAISWVIPGEKMSDFQAQVDAYNNPPQPENQAAVAASH